MTYAIERYPAELIDIVHLSGGEQITIRPVLPQDEELLASFPRSFGRRAPQPLLPQPARAAARIGA